MICLLNTNGIYRTWCSTNLSNEIIKTASRLLKPSVRTFFSSLVMFSLVTSTHLKSVYPNLT